MPAKAPPSSPVSKPELVSFEIGGEATMKHIGGSDSDCWNSYFLGRLVAAFPSGSGAKRPETIQAVIGAQMALTPKDPIEAMLAGQMLAANEAALDLYRRAWVPEQPFEVRIKFLALADKATRTVAVLTEALDRHRGRGQQHITVKHVTVNADQAVVADQVVTGGRSQGGGRDGKRKCDQPHALGHSPGAPLHSALEADRTAVPRAGG